MCSKNRLTKNIPTAAQVPTEGKAKLYLTQSSEIQQHYYYMGAFLQMSTLLSWLVLHARWNLIRTPPSCWTWNASGGFFALLHRISCLRIFLSWPHKNKQTEMRSFFTEEDGVGVGVHGLGQVRSGLHVETYRQAQGLKGMR